MKISDNCYIAKIMVVSKTINNAVNTNKMATIYDIGQKSLYLIQV